jgi:hypothetical protein
MDKSEHCKEVYARHGLAMYRAQCVEQSITQLLIYFDFFAKQVPLFQSKEQWLKEFDSFDQMMSAKTMGQLVVKLVGVGAVDPSIENLLRDALKARNFLAHRFFVDFAMDFLSESGRNKMILDLERKTTLFDEVEAVLNPITYDLCAKYGLTQEKLKEIEQHLFKEAKGDLDPP